MTKESAKLKVESKKKGCKKGYPNEDVNGESACLTAKKDDCTWGTDALG